MATVNGTAGNDFIHVLGDLLSPPVGYADMAVATNGDDVITAGGGNDIISAGGGGDTLIFQGNFTAQDQIDGGSGNDTLLLNGDYSAGVTFAATTLVNVETVNLSAGHSYKFVTNDATIAAGIRFKIDGTALSVGDSLTVDASAETDGMVTLVGGAGNDTFTGGAGSDFLYLYQGGNDTAYGGGGDDVFVFFGTFTAADHIDGGAGNDTVYLHGNYSVGVTFSATTMVNVETLDLDDFFDVGDNYKLTTNDATVAAGKTLTVTGGFLSSATHLVFNGAAETDGSFVIQSGAANDTLTGGAKNDTFTGGAGNDTIDGGGGIDTASYSGNRANYSIAFDIPTQTFTIADLRANSPDGTDTDKSIEQLKFADGLFGYDSSGHVTSQTVTNQDGGKTQTLLDPADIKPWATQVLNIDAQGRLTSQTVTTDAGALWVNTFDTGSASWTWKTDRYDAASHQLSQNGTNDDGSHWLTLFDVANQYAWSSVTLTYDAQWMQTGLAANNDNGTHTVAMGAVASALDTALWFTTPYDADFNPVPALLSGSAADYVVTFDAARQAYVVADQRVGAPDGAHTVSTQQMVQFADGLLPVAAVATRYEGSSGDDVIAGNDRGGLYDLTQGGHDTVTGGSGDDGFRFASDFGAADHVNGGGGTNQLGLDGDYSTGLTLSGSFVQNIQVVALLGAFNDTLTAAGDLVAAGDAMTFWSVSMTAAHHVAIDGSAETGGAFRFFLGQGADTAIGGAGADLFVGNGGQDTVRGNGGADTFTYLAVSDSTGVAHDIIQDFTAGTDRIDLPFAVQGIDAAVTAGALSTTTFDGDLAAAVGPDHLAAGHAVLFTADTGALAAHTILVVDANGVAGYQAGADLVIDVTGGANLAALSATDFI